MKVWTTPEAVEAIQWWPLMGILRGTVGMGCWQCGVKPCASSAHHEPIAHPHHLEIQTWKGPAAIFPSDYLITYRDGRLERVTAVEYRQRFSEVPFLPASERPDAATPVTFGSGNATEATETTVLQEA